MSIEYRIGDVFERLAEIPDNSIDLIVTSPPFLALRSYLPDDHEHKHLEIGSEPTPAEFIDTLLTLTAEWGRVLAPHGSLCVELGDTFSGGNTVTLKAQDRPQDGGYDYMHPDRVKREGFGHNSVTGIRNMDDKHQGGGDGWPLAKSMTGIPTLYPWSLAYGRNLLTGTDSPAGLWRIRNVIVWARPNPPVGALGDKFRPATSYITVACKSAKRYFDLDAVRGNPATADTTSNLGVVNKRESARVEVGLSSGAGWKGENPAGAPPLDWHTDNHPEDGDWLWKLSTQPYKGSHYATFPMALPKRLIEAMCPQRVCLVCGVPSTRIVESEIVGDYADNPQWMEHRERSQGGGLAGPGGNTRRHSTTLGWSDCGHNNYRTGITLDPVAGSGTTLDAAQAVGRHAIGIDLDERNAELARNRVGMFMDIIL